MVRSRRKELDTRLDWRDPEMPCLRVSKDEWSGELSVLIIEPEVVQTVSQQDLVEVSGYNYRLDASYHWRRQARNAKLAARVAEGFPLDCFNTCKTADVCIYLGCKKEPTR